ncbi:predicted protein [Uncinocarpus reesii 1704]|uniref:Uncharacterized protein n=1 Tax=Uncinocarpus reesii (strain UAMH 1704) TaxID=336963 RepID=C4JV55_UNCRE|nr:uncharacterized protein UREG_06447 [Uncinocarpus reesii 1704]EEP81582.1 predicted protein [Uncinocarpus reesii 1704]
MIAVEPAPPEAEIFAGLNNIIARSTSPKKSYESLKKQESSAPKAQTQPAKQKYQLWPNIKKTVSSSGRSTPDGTKTMRNPFKDGGLSRCHKISVPDLGQLSTIQERSLDSPTIPGQYPIHERSNSAPGACAGNSTARTPVLGPVGESCTKAAEQCGDNSSSPRRTDNKSKACTVQQNETHQPSNSSNLRQATFDEPPEVPPKSPRLALRIPNILGFSSSGEASSASTIGATLSSQSSKSLEESPWRSSPNLLGQTLPCRTSATPTNLTNGSTAPTSSIRRGPSCHKRTRTEEPNQSAPFEYGSDNPNNHRRGLSHDSVLQWGSHPPKKNAAVEVRVDDTEMAKKLPGVPTPNFPLGIPVHKASRVLPRAEIETLQRQAHNQAQKFEVLNRL